MSSPYDLQGTQSQGQTSAPQQAKTPSAGPKYRPSSNALQEIQFHDASVDILKQMAERKTAPRAHTDPRTPARGWLCVMLAVFTLFASAYIVGLHVCFRSILSVWAGNMRASKWKVTTAGVLAILLIVPTIIVGLVAPFSENELFAKLT